NRTPPTRSPAGAPDIRPPSRRSNNPGCWRPHDPIDARPCCNQDGNETAPRFPAEDGREDDRPPPVDSLGTAFFRITRRDNDCLPPARLRPSRLSRSSGESPARSAERHHQPHEKPAARLYLVP